MVLSHFSCIQLFALQRRRPGSDPWVRNRERDGYLLQYYCLENPMDRGAWRATVYRGAESRTTESLMLSLLVSAVPLSSVLCPTSRPSEAGGGRGGGGPEASAGQLQAGAAGLLWLPVSRGVWGHPQHSPLSDCIAVSSLGLRGEC